MVMLPEEVWNRDGQSNYPNVVTQVVGKFHLRPMEQLTFEKRVFGNQNLFYALQKNVGKQFVSELKYVCQKQANIVINIFGLPESGKSEVGQSIALTIRNNFEKFLGIKSKIYIGFSYQQTMRFVQRAETGDVIIQDEKPKQYGAGSRIMMESLWNILKAIRAKQVNFIFISPEYSDMRVTNLTLETCGMIRSKKITRCILYSRFGAELGHLIFKLHKDDAFRERYEKEKMENIDKLMEAKGQSYVKVDKEKLLGHCDQVLDYMRENDINSVKGTEMEAICSELGISGSGNYMENLKNLVKIKSRILLNKKKKQKADKKIKESKSIEADSEDFESYVSERIKKELDKGYTKSKIFSDYVAGATQLDIADSMGLSQSQVSKKLREVREKYIGYWFEDWWITKNGGTPNEDKNRPDPDWVDDEGNIYSLKCYLQKRKSVTINIRKKCKPEIKGAIKNGTTFRIVFRNPFWGKTSITKPLDPHDLPVTATFYKTQKPKYRGY